MAALLIPGEKAAVAEHLIGFPDDNPAPHQLRPYVLCFLCFIPFLAALYYGLCRALDRYLIRQFLGAFAICFSALYAIWLIIDLTDNLGDFREASTGFGFVLYFYLTQFPYAFIELVPFSLLLALLYSLGKLSKSCEIIAYIQTGRGIARLILPLIVLGFLLGLVCLCFNYHWAPYASGYQEALIEKTKTEEGTTSKARNVFYHDKKSDRFWFIGSFPYNYTQGEPLRNVQIRTFSGNQSNWKLTAAEAAWDRETGDWTFTDSVISDLDATFENTGTPLPTFHKQQEPITYTDWPETPWQLIKPGLNAPYLGIPDLDSWLTQNKHNPWAAKLPFITQWHYRWAQPWICLAIILLAAPLGIVFSRRGTAGGIALAIFLSVTLMFSSTVFLALGESSYLPPAIAAWGTNILALVISLFLIQRRLAGRPIYQTLKKFLPGGA